MSGPTSIIRARSSAASPPDLKPVYEYLQDKANFDKTELTAGSADWIEVEGRAGMVSKNRNAFAKLPAHTVNADHGSVSMWLCPLDDLNTRITPQWVSQYFPNADVYPLLSDIPNGRDRWAAKFIWQWDTGWYPQFYAKFNDGPIYANPNNPKHYTSAYDPDAGFKAIVTTQHFGPRRLNWYYLTLTWDKPAGDFRIYVNGILAGVSEKREPVSVAQAGDTLYAGNPSWVLSDIAFYDRVPDPNAVRKAYLSGGGQADTALDRALRRMYAGEFHPRLAPFDSAGWELQVDIPMNRDADLECFYVQGAQTARVTEQGIRITNPVERQKGAFKAIFGEQAVSDEHKELLAPPGTFDAGKPRDLTQSYLWLKQQTDGDVRVELEFKSLRDDGLALLIAQATGMQREDFMADDPVRTSGSMSMVCWENVRNYHWEFFREVDDVRRDIASHALAKNPHTLGLGLSHQKEQLSLNEWHKLVFAQDGAKLTCAINGEVVLEATDNPDTNNGPVYLSGRVAIRCMRATDMVFRNLKIWVRPTGVRSLGSIHAK